MSLLLVRKSSGERTDGRIKPSRKVCCVIRSWTFLWKVSRLLDYPIIRKIKMLLLIKAIKLNEWWNRDLSRDGEKTGSLFNYGFSNPLNVFFALAHYSKILIDFFLPKLEDILQYFILKIMKYSKLSFVKIEFLDKNWLLVQCDELAPLSFIDPLRIIGNPCLYLTLLHTSCTAHDISDFSFITCHSGQLEIEGDNHTTVGKINNFFRHENKSFDGIQKFFIKGFGSIPSGD